MATSCARCPIGNDFSCGFHSMRSSGTRSRTRRVVTISTSNSGRRRSEIGMAGGRGGGGAGLPVHRELGVGLRWFFGGAVGAGELVAEDAHVVLAFVEEALQGAGFVAGVRVGGE